MPRFFFHVYDDADLRDDQGLYLSGPDEARAAALSGARGMICEQVRLGRVDLRHRIEVEDEAGRQVLVLHFGEAVEISN